MRVALLWIGIVGLLACDPKNEGGDRGRSPVASSRRREMKEEAMSPVPPSAMPVATASAPASPPAAPTLTAAERAGLLQQTLDIGPLRPFWHPEKGTFPIHVLLNDAVRERPPLTTNGTPVVYDEDSKRRPFEFTKVEGLPPRVRIDFRYANEGVVGHAVFVHNGTWTLEEKAVVEH